MHRGLRPGLRLLARTPVTPDMLTGARLLTGVVAAVAIAFGTSRAQDAGGAVFLLSMLLDRADGELARLIGRFSRFGGRFDVVSDCLATALCLAALGPGFRPPWMSPWGGWALGAVAAVGIVALFVRLEAMPPALGGRGPGTVPRRPFDPDDSLVILPVMIWCGAGQGMLWLTAVGTPLAAILVWGVLGRGARVPRVASGGVLRPGQRPQRVQQRVALVVRADGDAQVIGDAGGGEVPHQHAALP